MKWPIFHCLSAQSQALLMQFQYDNFGVSLDIPPVPEDVHIEPNIESLEEIDKIIREPTKGRKLLR